MKKLLLLATAFIAITASETNAQPRKGDWMVGAKVNPMALKGGYFLSNRFIAGVDVMPAFYNRKIETSIFQKRSVLKIQGFNLV